MVSAVGSSVLFSVGLCLASAVFYVAGTAAMKLYGHLPFAMLMVPVGLTLLVAAWFEVAVLRHARMGQVFLLIFAFEVTLTALVALLVLNEKYAPREYAGLATIVAGIGLLLSGRAEPLAVRLPAEVNQTNERSAVERLHLGFSARVHDADEPGFECGMQPLLACQASTGSSRNADVNHPAAPALRE